MKKKVTDNFVILVVWIVAFVLKIIIGYIGTTNFNWTEEKNFLSAILIVLYCILTELVPYFFTL